VLTVSIHGHPSFAYPFFSGYEDEVGEGEGVGANLNITLPERIEPGAFHAALDRANRAIADAGARALVVSLGFDTGRGDPTGTWPLAPKDFFRVGRSIAALGLPTVIVQEGGYRTTSLGQNARQFFLGLSGEECPT